MPEIQMYVCNKERYGYLNVPAKPHHALDDDRLNFVHVHLESMSKNRRHLLYVNIKEKHCQSDDRKTNWNTDWEIHKIMTL